MHKFRVGEVVLDRCPTCRGFWVDRPELEKLLDEDNAAKRLDERAVSDPGHSSHEAPFKCPRDRSDLIELVHVEQRHIHYESCTICGGMFFDAQELTDLSELTLAERLRSLFGR